MGGSSGPSRTTQTQEPPAFIRPYLESGAQQAQALYNTGGPQQYGGQTVVPFAPQTEQALELTQQRALNGSQVGNAAQSYATDKLSNPITSQYGGASNPYLDQTFNRAADNVQNRLQSSFAGGGRNIGAARAPAALELNDLANQVYGGAYESERDRMQADINQQRGIQFSLAGLAPQLGGMDYQDLAALEGVGGRVEDLSGQYIDDAARRFNFDQNAPQTNLDNYLARISGSFPGGTTTQSTPTSRNRAAGALGGAASGAATGANFGPYGAVIGGVAGGLLGAYG